MTHTFRNNLGIRHFALYGLHIRDWGTLRKKCPCSELFWSVFSRIRTEYEETPSISPYPVQIQENTDQNNSEYGHFSHSV